MRGGEARFMTTPRREAAQPIGVIGNPHPDWWFPTTSPHVVAYGKYVISLRDGPAIASIIESSPTRGARSTDEEELR